MKKIFSFSALCLMASVSVAFAQQAPPAGYNAALQHLTAPDGSIFQVLSSSGAFDPAATGAAYNAYVAANTQPTPAGPTSVTKAAFLRLLTSTEQIALVTQEAQANALTAAQMSSPTAQQTALITLQAWMMQWNAMGPSDTLSLSDPTTTAAVNAFLTLGVVSSQARVTAILAGQPSAS